MTEQQAPDRYTTAATATTAAATTAAFMMRCSPFLPSAMYQVHVYSSLAWDVWI